MFEGSAGGVQERKGAIDVIMLKLKGALGPEWLVTVESSVTGHLQMFSGLADTSIVS